MSIFCFFAATSCKSLLSSGGRLGACMAANFNEITTTQEDNQLPCSAPGGWAARDRWYEGAACPLLTLLLAEPATGGLMFPLKLLKLESVEVTPKMHALATGYDFDTKWNSTRKPTLDEPACVKTSVESLVAQIESLEY
jgi:hypothetical protein